MPLTDAQYDDLIAQVDRWGKPAAITCPKCGGTHITSNARGFSAGKALAGDLLVGPIGLLAGASGNSKVLVTCLDCGTQWAAGKRESKARSIERIGAAREAAEEVGGFIWKLARVVMIAVGAFIGLGIAAVIIGAINH